MIAILTAFAAGKVIQCRRIGDTDYNPWLTASTAPDNWSWTTWEFRIKSDLYEAWVNIYTVGRGQMFYHHPSKEIAEANTFKSNGLRPDRIAVHMREVE